ncbi:unnamed protein product, partial [marine sediment metagenome]
GLGNMGSIIAKELFKKEGVEIVGAIARRKEKEGKDLGRLLNFDKELGIRVTNDAKSLFETTETDILLHCTTSFVEQVYHQIKLALEKRINVITIATVPTPPRISGLIDKLISGLPFIFM